MIYARIAGIVFAVLCLFGAGYHFGGLASKVKLETAIAADEKVEAKQVEQQAITNSVAEAKHDDTLEALPTIVTKPVWLYHDKICPVSVPTPAGSPATPAPAAEPGPGPSDIGPALTAFKVRYETALADCRRLYDEWPK